MKWNIKWRSGLIHEFFNNITVSELRRSVIADLNAYAVVVFTVLFVLVVIVFSSRIKVRILTEDG